jgi:hypothetical protein
VALISIQPLHKFQSPSNKKTKTVLETEEGLLNMLVFSVLAIGI